MILNEKDDSAKKKYIKSLFNNTTLSSSVHKNKLNEK